MRILSVIGIMVLGLALGACEQEVARFDTTSEVAFKASARAVGEGMPADQQPALKAAMAQIMFSSLGNAMKGTLGSKGQPQSIIASVGPVLNGRTGAEVIAIAADMERKRIERQFSAIDSEIAALKADIDQAREKLDADVKVLGRISVERARYYWWEQSFYAQAITAFKITNGSDRAIAKIYLDGVLETPGRSVPWVRGSLIHAIKGGLEPGETQSLELAPRGDWADTGLKKRSDLVLTLSLRAVEDANGVKIGSRKGDGIQSKRKRLKSLQQQREKLLAQRQ